MYVSHLTEQKTTLTGVKVEPEILTIPCIHVINILILSEFWFEIIVPSVVYVSIDQLIIDYYAD